MSGLNQALGRIKTHIDEDTVEILCRVAIFWLKKCLDIDYDSSFGYIYIYYNY